MSRGNCLRKMCYAVVATIILTSCSGGSPSGVADKFFSSMIKKDYKTAAKYVHAIDAPELTNKEKAEILKETDTYNGVIAKYNVIGEEISADGKNAWVTIDMGTWLISDMQLVWDEIKLIKTEFDGWKVVMQDFDTKKRVANWGSVLKKYSEKYGIVDNNPNKLGVSVNFQDKQFKIRYYNCSEYLEHLDNLSDRWIILNEETLDNIAIEPVNYKTNGRYFDYLAINFKDKQQLNDLRFFLLCFQGVEKTEWEAKSTPPLFYVISKNKYAGLSVLNKNPFKAEKLFYDANISINKNPLPVIEKFIPAKVLAKDMYGYEKSLGNGKSFSIICELRITDKDKTVTRFFACTKTVVGNETRSQSFSSENGIEILNDNTFSASYKESALNGKIEKDIIRGTVVLNGEKFPFQAKTSNIESCKKCLGTGSSMEGNMLDNKPCRHCNGFGKIPR